MNILRARSRGQNVTNVRNINLSNLNLCDMTIVSQMPYIEIFMLNRNEISSLKYFSGCLYLREMHLRDNRIDNVEEFKHLKDLHDLSVLSVEGNPFTKQHVFTYRRLILRILPRLTKIDDVEVSAEERQFENDKKVDEPKETQKNDDTRNISSSDVLLTMESSPETSSTFTRGRTSIPQMEEPQSLVSCFDKNSLQGKKYIENISNKGSSTCLVTEADDHLSTETKEILSKISVLDMPYTENLILLSIGRCIVSKLDYDALIALERAIRQRVENVVLKNGPR